MSLLSCVRNGRFLDKPAHDVASALCRRRGLLSGERQALFHKLNLYPALSQPGDQFPHIVDVAAEPVHRVANHRVTFPHERQQRRELGPVYVLAQGSVEKATVQLDSFELPPFVLIEAAYAQVANPLTLHDGFVRGGFPKDSNGGRRGQSRARQKERAGLIGLPYRCLS